MNEILSNTNKRGCIWHQISVITFHIIDDDDNGSNIKMAELLVRQEKEKKKLNKGEFCLIQYIMWKCFYKQKEFRIYIEIYL